MTAITVFSIVIYSTWKVLNIQQSYFFNKRMTYGSILNILLSILMCYWLTISSILFLIIKIADGIFSLLLGGYLYIVPGPEEFIKDRGKVINGYLGYAIIDMIVCCVCFIMSVLGVSHG